jgi:hypothetical protein
MQTRRCKQTQCTFYVNDSCKPCSGCAAEPYKINISCGRCLSCETRPNSLRFEDLEFEDKKHGKINN